METVLTIVIALLAPNLVNFLAMGIDKRLARQGAFRTPESVFFCLAIIGGSIGGLLGMLVFHHKTRKWKFRIGMPAILALQLLILYLIWRSPVDIRLL